VSRAAYYKWLAHCDRPYKHTEIAKEIRKILAEDEYNDAYSPERMRSALVLRREQAEEKEQYFPKVPSVSTLRRVMKHEGLISKKRRTPKGLTEADKEAQKSDNLLNRDFSAEKPYEKCVTDITQVTCADGKLYIFGIFDCFDNSCLSLKMADNMEAVVACDTLKAAVAAHPALRANNAIVHSDRGSQYTSRDYRKCVEKCGIRQSMNSAAGRCHDNAKCESMWARFKEECVYGRLRLSEMSIEAVKTVVWRYFMSYWNNRRVCSANGGIPPVIKRSRFFQSSNALAAA